MIKNIVSVDLGQQNDFTAVSVIKPIVIEGQNQYHLIHLERFRLHTPYPQQVQRVKDLLQRLDNTTLIIDRTGVGIAVFDMFRATVFTQSESQSMAATMLPTRAVCLVFPRETLSGA